MEINNVLICPYCGSTDSEHRDVDYDDDFFSGGITATCNNCQKKFQFSACYHIDYEPWKTDCLNGGEHIWGIDVGLFGRTYIQCKTCSESKPGDIYTQITHHSSQNTYTIRYCTWEAEISDDAPEEELMELFDQYAIKLKECYDNDKDQKKLIIENDN